VIRAVFFDLGSTLWDDYPSELAYWETLSGIFARRGLAASLEQIMALVPEVIASYCPSLTRAIVWRTVGADRQLYDEVIAELVRHMLERFRDPAEFRRLNPLFDGVPVMLDLLARKYTLAVVSQNFAEAQEWMQFHGLSSYFEHTTLSGKEHMYKPDPRLFLRTCEALNVEPREVVMVGDRLDNDIWPANRLRMTTVRVLADPYRIQQPRYHCDVPDFTVEHTPELLNIVPL